jgi:SAM-dependent methyltransferase
MTARYTASATTAAVSAHYSAIAAASSSRPRARSTTLAWRRYCNDVKQQLIQAVVTRGGAMVLDMACGRGGDVHKFIAINAAHVDGIDVSSDCVEEATRRSRAALLARHAAAPPITMQFTVADMTAPLALPAAFYSHATCFFALHYACASAATFRAFALNAVQALRPGGTLVAVFPCAARMCELAEAQADDAARGTHHDSAPVFSVRAAGFPEARMFGAAEFTVSLTDCMERCVEPSVPEVAIVDCLCAVGFQCIDIDYVSRIVAPQPTCAQSVQASQLYKFGIFRKATLS